MTDLARRLFDSISLNADLKVHSAEDLWDLIQEPEANGLPTGPSVVYRGQSNARHSLSSSLYRLCLAALGPEARITEAQLAAAEQAIITASRGQGLGRRMTDGELLMVLQHHGIPTRLVDVSLLPQEALFFAVDSNDDAPGRLFIIDYQDDELTLAAPSEHGPQDLSERQLPWADNAKGTRSAGEWTETVALIKDAPLDPRIRAQAGKFLVGGLNRRNAGRNIRIAENPAVSVPREDYPNISTLGINFLRQRRAARNACWPATGWTLTIEAQWKRDLRERLAQLSDAISFDTMYPPVSEVRRLTIEEAKRALTHT